MSATMTALRAATEMEVTAMPDEEADAINAMTFDAALAELERTVAELEAGGQPLERTIALYERGVALQQRCEQLLADAELRVRRLVEGARGAVAEAELREDEAG
jgi:exodeoxyribonuclease VII small subunit